MSDALPPLWSPETDDTLVCVAAFAETHDVKTFVFAAAPARRFSYQPGQFLTLELSINGETVNRCYTLSSAPTRPDRLSITVKAVVEGGPVSHWLHANLKPGMSLKVLGPMGEFACQAAAPGKYLFLSAGSGITPLMSMTRAAADLASGADIAFVHSARSPADLIFRDELARLERACAGLKVTSICEHDASTAHGGEVWGGYRGRLDITKLGLIAPDFLEREVFVCGPAPYMAAVKTMLETAGFDMRRYHSESFDFAELSGADAPAEALREGDQTFQATFSTSRRSVTVRADQFVLDAAREAGLRLPSSCAKGMCGTCKCKLISGTVEMTPAGGIRQREIDQGLILICCARPTSDLVIER